MTRAVRRSDAIGGVLYTYAIRCASNDADQNSREFCVFGFARRFRTRGRPEKKPKTKPDARFGDDVCAVSPRDIPSGVPFEHARRRTSLTGTMVKSHVECSPDLTWALVQKANVFVRRSRSATRQKTFRSFSAETNNLMSLHTYKHSGAYASRAPRRVPRRRKRRHGFARAFWGPPASPRPRLDARASPRVAARVSIDEKP